MEKAPANKLMLSFGEIGEPISDTRAEMDDHPGCICCSGTGSRHPPAMRALFADVHRSVEAGTDHEFAQRWGGGAAAGAFAASGASKST